MVIHYNYASVEIHTLTEKLIYHLRPVAQHATKTNISIIDNCEWFAIHIGPISNFYCHFVNEQLKLFFFLKSDNTITTNNSIYKIGPYISIQNYGS